MFRLELEAGQSREYAVGLAELPTLRHRCLEGEEYLVKEWVIPEEFPGVTIGCTSIWPGNIRRACCWRRPRGRMRSRRAVRSVSGACSPRCTPCMGRPVGRRRFLRPGSPHALGGRAGGSLVATLPLLSTLWELEGDPSPYVPASRLFFWNEFYLDVTRVPEFAAMPGSPALLETAEFREELRTLRSSPRVDYRRQMRLKRQVLEARPSSFSTSRPSGVPVGALLPAASGG